MKRYFQLRPLIRKALIFLFVASLLVANVLVNSQASNASTLHFAIALSILTLLNEFSPEAISWILSRFGDPKHHRLIEDRCVRYNEFLSGFFLVLNPPALSSPTPPTLFASLEAITASIPSTPFGKNQSSDKRRRSAVILLFLVLNWDDGEIDEYENQLAYIKRKYRDLTDKGKAELIHAYWTLVLGEHKYANAELYFIAPDEADAQRARLHFFDRFMKDDYVEEIARALKLRESQIETFKGSLQAVANSGRLNLDHLRRFVSARARFRKLFVVTSDTKLPKRIQSYISQNPHFILNWASIANLPRIGLSRRFDIFFFSPSKLIPSATAALAELARIDESVLSHPVKVYEVDPTQSASSALERSPSFAQAIRFFEDASIDTGVMGDLTYDQLLSVLEHANVSLKDLLRELPIAEFSSAAFPEEKPYLESLFKRIAAIDGGRDIFRTIGSMTAVSRRITALKKIPVDYSGDHIRQEFAGKASLDKARSRLRKVAGEIVSNIEALNDMLV
ncbi:MAG: hypothetical protein A2139_14100 [Desulfobacca sp. RBG_16_60_12]|nr:MAG: hypothetical protein A2139_14100 [Desulfobacca sp. RBG_16_60_12]